MIVGRHEANVVLKDNDLRNRISLRPDDAREVLKILKKDSDLLGELGVLDYRFDRIFDTRPCAERYSLLVGVKKGKFEIKGDTAVLRTVRFFNFNILLWLT